MPNKYENKYRQLKDEAPVVVRCAACGSMCAKKQMEPHHPRGRWGKDILNFVWVHSKCHRYIHNEGQEWARLNGLLFTQIHHDDSI